MEKVLIFKKGQTTSLKNIKQIFSKVAQLVLIKFKDKTVDNGDFPIILKEFFRKIIFNLFGVIPLTIWKVLLILQDDLIEEVFRYETTRIRKLKKKRAVRRLRTVPSYMYYTTFLERRRRLPLVMPKESSCYRKAITSNFTFKLRYKHKVRLDKRAIREVMGSEEVDTSKQVSKIHKKKEKITIRELKGVKTRKFLRLRSVGRKYNRGKSLIIGYFRVGKYKRGGLDRRVRVYLKHFTRDLSKQNISHLKVSLQKALQKEKKNKTDYKELVRTKGRRIQLNSRWRPHWWKRRKWKHSSAYYRVRRIERRKKKKVLKMKRRVKKQRRVHWSEIGLKFWRPKPFFLRKKLILRISRLTTFNDRTADLIKTLLLIASAINTAQHVIPLEINSSFTPRLRSIFYKKYYSWSSLLEKQMKMRWRRADLRTLERKTQFKFFDPSVKNTREIPIRLKNKNWFIITFKWSTRNFYLNVCSTRHGGGIFKTTSGLLGAKKKNKRRFRYIRKSLYYLLRFILFYRRRLFKQQRKKFVDYYYTFLDLWNRRENKNRFSNRRSILLDTRRWIRSAKRRILMHLIIEWFGREDRYDVYARFIKRLKRIQYRRVEEKSGRLYKVLKIKKKIHYYRAKKKKCHNLIH